MRIKEFCLILEILRVTAQFLLYNNVSNTADKEKESFMKKNVYGYVRVSTREQNVERQLIALKKMGISQSKIFIDRQSGKDFKEIGADIIIQDMPLLNTTKSRDLLGNFISDVVLQLLSFVAENERNNIRTRQAEGIEAAKQRGVRFGKPAIPVPENFSELYRRWEQGSININEFARLCNMGRSTMYKHIREYKRMSERAY